MDRIIPLDLCNGGLNEVYLTLIAGGRINSDGDVKQDPAFNDYLATNGLERLDKFLKGYPGSYDHNGIYVHTSKNAPSTTVNYVDALAVSNIVVELIVKDSLANYLWKYQDALLNFLMAYEFGLANVSFEVTTFTKAEGANGNYCTVEMCFILRPLVDSDDTDSDEDDMEDENA